MCGKRVGPHCLRKNHLSKTQKLRNNKIGYLEKWKKKAEYVKLLKVVPLLRT